MEFGKDVYYMLDKNGPWKYFKNWKWIKNLDEGNEKV
jgi:hypothetical protein